MKLRGRIFSDDERKARRKLEEDKKFVMENPRSVAVENLSEGRVREIEQIIKKDRIAMMEFKKFFKNKQASEPPSPPEPNIGKLEVRAPAIYEGYRRENGVLYITSEKEYPWGILHDDYLLTIRDNKGINWPSASHYIYASVLCYPLYALQVRTTTEIEAMKYTASKLYMTCLEKIQYDSLMMGYKKAIEANMGMQDAIINNMRGEYVWAYLNNHAILGIGADGAGYNLLGRIITAVSMQYVPILSKPSMVMEFDDSHPWSMYAELPTAFQVDGSSFKRVVEYVYYSYFKLFLGNTYQAYAQIQSTPMDQLESVFADLQSKYFEKKITKATAKILQWKFQQHVNALRVLKTAPVVNTVSVGFINAYVDPITNRFLNSIQSKLRDDPYPVISPYKLVNITQQFFSPPIQTWVLENRLPDAIRTINLVLDYLRIKRKTRPVKVVVEVLEIVEDKVPDVEWNDVLEDEPIAENEVEIFGVDDEEEIEDGVEAGDIFDDGDPEPTANVDGSVDWIIASIMENFYHRCGTVPNILFDGYPQIFFDRVIELMAPFEIDCHSIYYLWCYIGTLIYYANSIRGEFTIEEVVSNAMDQTPQSFEMDDMVTTVVNLLYHIEICVNATMGSFSIGESEFKLVQKLLGFRKPLKVKPIKEDEIDDRVVELTLRLEDVLGLYDKTLLEATVRIYFLAKYLFKRQRVFGQNIMSKINFYS
jgi:predicted NAD-dependent protein-ADP-ribosyltransferase YbiA (DUF1768 family)